MTSRAELGIKSAKLISELTPEGIQRELHLTGAYNLRKAPDGKDYGVHGMEMLFIAKRGNCAVSWLWMTPFHLPEVRQSLESSMGRFWYYDGIGDIGCHSPVPTYEGQSLTHESCEYTGGKCYSDRTSLGSCEAFDRVVRDPERIWPELETRLKELEKTVTEQNSLERNFS